MPHTNSKKRQQAGARGGRGGSSGKRGGFASKSRKPKEVKEVVWDDEARREYLTGFSKRKKEKKDAARERAVKKEKEAYLEMRQQLRTARKDQAAKNVAMAKEYYGGTEGEISESDGEEEEAQEHEYANDEMTSRVVIEDMNLDAADDTDVEEDGDVDMDGPNSNMFAMLAPSRVKAKRKPEKKSSSFVTPNDSPPKPKPKKFTYETKAARKAEALKQKARRMEKAQYSKSGRGGKSGRGSAKKRKF